MDHNFVAKVFLCLYAFTCILGVAGVGGEQRRISRLPLNLKRAKRADDDTDEATENATTRYARPSAKIKYQQFEVPKDYNKLQIPSFAYVLAMQKEDVLEDGRLFEIFEILTHDVIVTLRIKNIAELDESNEEVIFAVDLILEWKDGVISWTSMQKYNRSEEFESEEAAHLFKTLDPEFLKKIWKPDIYFLNLIKVQHPEVMSEPITIRLNELTGEIIYVSRMRIQMECEMDFHYYPADTQECQVVMKSNSYSTDELNLQWSKPNGVFLEDCAGPNYDFQLSDVDDKEIEEGFIGTKVRNFSALGFKIVARRKLSYHMVQTFLPSVFFIIITWLCFLVPSRIVEARIGISMTTLLTLTAMFASVRESTPSVSYVRAIDIWMIACIFFVFLTLLEFSILIWLRNMKEEMDAEEEENKKNENPPEAAMYKDVEFKPLNTVEGAPSENFKLGHRQRRKRAEIQNNISEYIEKHAFWIFSITFVVFCSVYWSWLLIGSGYYDWKVDRTNSCKQD